MAGLSIKVEIRRDDLRRIERMIHNVVGFDFTGLHRKLGNAVLNSTLDRFKQGVDPDGKPWPPSERAKKTAGGKTLIDTGRLRASLTVKPDAHKVEVGTNVVYARIHQLGGKAGRGKKTGIPARPYLGINDEDRKVLQRIVDEHVKEKLG